MPNPPKTSKRLNLRGLFDSVFARNGGTSADTSPAAPIRRDNRMTRKAKVLPVFETVAAGLLTPAESEQLKAALVRIIDGTEKPAELPRVVKRSEVMRALGVSRSTVNNLARRGALVRVRPVGAAKGYGYTVESVEALLKGANA